MIDNGIYVQSTNDYCFVNYSLILNPETYEWTMVEVDYDEPEINLTEAQLNVL